MERLDQTFQDIKPILDVFKQTYMEKPPVIGAGLGAEYTRRGSQRFVFRAYLGSKPTADQQKSLKKTFRGVPIRYEVTGPIVAAGAAGSFEERFPELAAVQTLDDLNKLVGEITPEEQRMIDSIDFNAPLTSEELTTMGPDFITRVIDKTLRRIKTPFNS